MFESEMRIEVERRLLKACDERAKAGLPQADLNTLRAIVRNDLTRELEARRQDARPAPKTAPAPVHIPVPVAAPVAPPKPAPVPVSPVKPPAAPVAPHVAAERVRVQRIIAMTPKGAEDECGDAIRSGMPVAEFEGVLAARTILEAARFVRGA